MFLLELFDYLTFVTFDFSYLSPKSASQGNDFFFSEHFALYATCSMVNLPPDFHVFFHLDGVSRIIAVILKPSARVNLLLG